MRLTPALVFVAKPNDPIIGRILAKLAPKLKAIGYECFFDKTPRDTTLEDQIASIEKNEQIYAELKRQFESHGLDVTNKQHLEKFVLLTIMSMGISLAQYTASDFLTNIGQLIDHYPAEQTYKTFLQTLAKHKIAYQGVDFRSFDKTVSLATIYAYGKFREENMAELYLNASQSIFGRAEPTQAVAIQRDLLKRISLEEAAARFCFFDLNADLSSENILTTSRFPFISIDTQNKNDDQIISLIVQKIIEKQVLLNDFVMKRELCDDLKDMDFEQFKEAYYAKYNSHFLFKNPLSTMKRGLENGTIKSMDDVIQYVEAYPTGTRTVEVLREFKLTR